MERDLKSVKCAPCEVGAVPLSGSVLGEYLSELHEEWELLDGNKKIRRSFLLKDFKSAIEFVNSVAALAESEGHHPDIHVENFKNVILELWTHKINGLSENDFIMAAKIDSL